MTNYYVTYRTDSKEARDGYFKEVKENGIIEKSRAEEGCVRYAYFYPADSDTDLFLWEQWESRDAQKKHTQQPHFAVLGTLKEKYNVKAEIVIEDQIVEK
ncbi:antibiotic biosynthesis monooxygenase [bacterium 210820-DFI.6.37]|nr:antibiotic biosynthesis monooxygenase [bacterium 210820-DFI.6.37]